MERFRDRVAVVVPAYNEEDNIGQCSPASRASVCGLEIAVLVVDDGSRDDTGRGRPWHGAAVARHAINLGGGAALRTGYRLMVDSGAPSWSRSTPTASTGPRRWIAWSAPCRTGGRRRARLACARTRRAEHGAREMGIVFFNRLVSLITRTKVSDCSNGYRAVRATVLPQLVLRQEQFHTSEFMIEAIKRGVPGDRGAGDRRQAPARAFQEACGPALRPRVHERDRQDLAAGESGTPSAGSGRTLGRVRQIQVRAAARADLDVELLDLAAARAAALRLLALRR